MKSVYNHKVSIIIPIYNCYEYLGKTLDSVFAQTYENIEIIMVNDCSTDDSYNLALKYAAKYPFINVYSLSKNSGPAIARNFGINKATGRFIAFIDSDDLWHPEKLTKQLQFMLDSNYEFTYTSYSFINESGIPTGLQRTARQTMTYKNLLKTNSIGCSTVIYDTYILGKIYMPLLKKRQDYATWLKILKITKLGHGMQESLTDYRLRKNSISNSKLALLQYNWNVFYRFEKLGFFRSLYYLIWNIAIKIFG